MNKSLGPRARARRQRILQAARQVFVQQGVEHTKIEDLIREAGISRATFYRAFHSLDEVVEALYREYTIHVLSRLEETLPTGKPPQEGLDEVIEGVFRDVEAQGPLLRILFREELRPGSLAEGFQAERVQRQVERISAWWKESTQIQPDPDLVLCCVLLMQGLTLLLARRETTPELQARYHRAAHYMLRAVIEAYLLDQAKL